MADPTESPRALLRQSQEEDVQDNYADFLRSIRDDALEAALELRAIEAAGVLKGLQDKLAKLSAWEEAKAIQSGDQETGRARGPNSTCCLSILRGTSRLRG